MALTAREVVAKGVGEKLRRYRTESGLSQERLAQRVGVSRETVRFAESGEGVPEWETLERLAAALDLEFWDLLPTRQEEGFRLSPRKAGALRTAAA